MTEKEYFEINLSIMMISFKIDALIKSLSTEQKGIYIDVISEHKRTFLDGVAKHLPEDRVLEFLSMLDVD